MKENEFVWVSNLTNINRALAALKEVLTGESSGMLPSDKAPIVVVLEETREGLSASCRIDETESALRQAIIDERNRLQTNLNQAATTSVETHTWRCIILTLDSILAEVD